jgi:hypothetical protein
MQAFRSTSALTSTLFDVVSANILIDPLDRAKNDPATSFGARFEVMGDELRRWGRISLLRALFLPQNQESPEGPEDGVWEQFYYDYIAGPCEANDIEHWLPFMDGLFARGHNHSFASAAYSINHWTLRLRQVILGLGMDGITFPSRGAEEEPDHFLYWRLILAHPRRPFRHLQEEEWEAVLEQNRRNELAFMRAAYLALPREDQAAILGDLQLLQEVVATPELSDGERAVQAYPAIYRLYMPMAKIGFNWIEESGLCPGMVQQFCGTLPEYEEADYGGRDSF